MKIYPLSLVKNYSEMSRIEKRAYKRWMWKNGTWDSDEIIERMEKEKTLELCEKK